MCARGIVSLNIQTKFGVRRLYASVGDNNNYITKKSIDQ